MKNQDTIIIELNENNTCDFETGLARMNAIIDNDISEEEVEDDSWLSVFDYVDTEEYKQIEEQKRIQKEIEIKTWKKCSRCSGKGHLQEFSHRMNGICYGCKGSGKVKR